MSSRWSVCRAEPDMESRSDRDAIRVIASTWIVGRNIVPVLRRVEVWPATGSPERPWLEDPDDDAFVRSARSVCELYSEGIARARLRAPSSGLRIICVDHDRSDEVLVVVGTRSTDDYGRVTLPRGVAALEAGARAQLVLEVVHGAMLRLAEARGWPISDLEAARAHVEHHEARFVWTGAATSSPDRRHTARPVYRLMDDGYGRVVLEVRRRADEVLVARSEEALAFSTLEGFQRSARTMRWRDKNTVELVPYCGLLSQTSGHLRVDVTAGAADEAAPSGADDLASDAAPGRSTPPPVSIRGET